MHKYRSIHDCIFEGYPGVCAIRLERFIAIRVAAGNIVSGGTLGHCDHYCSTLEVVWNVIINVKISSASV